MDSKKILDINNSEKGSCIDCIFGVLIPNNENIIDFAKCKAETESLSPLFNFNLYGDEYKGYLPKEGDILSKTNLPCRGELFMNK